MRPPDFPAQAGLIDEKCTKKKIAKEAKALRIHPPNLFLKTSRLLLRSATCDDPNKRDSVYWKIPVVVGFWEEESSTRKLLPMDPLGWGQEPVVLQVPVGVTTTRLLDKLGGWKACTVNWIKRKGRILLMIRLCCLQQS